MFDAARHAETLKIMELAPVIPVLTVKDVDDGIAQARALVAGGLYAIEVTLRTSAALAAIKAISAQVPGAYVGAGTIVEPEQIAEAVKAGARFLVSPGASLRLADAAATAPIPFLPGCATPSEAMELCDRGFRALKLFPAEAVGGARLLASIAAPLPDLMFCPTGGIDLAKAPSYLALPNVKCVGGSWMLPKSALEAGDYATVEALSAEAAKLQKA
jgi:2-dehydro-3-deoxyphosphogluconate aldolase / (4S)-4-hydroxy-2-oxoglutarate aldolase